jgi:hypothetical protein
MIYAAEAAGKLKMKIEYRVREIPRYIVTRYYEKDGGAACGSDQRGEYDNSNVAFEVAYALCAREHQSLGYPVGDDRIKYPSRSDLPRSAFGGNINSTN